MIPIMIDAMEPIEVNDTVVIVDKMPNYRPGIYQYDSLTYRPENEIEQTDDAFEEKIEVAELSAAEAKNLTQAKAAKHTDAFVWDLNNPHAILINTANYNPNCSAPVFDTYTVMDKAIDSSNLYFHQGGLLCE